MPNLTSTQVQPQLTQQQQIAAANARQGLPPTTGLTAAALPVPGAQTGAHTLTTPGAYGPGQSISGAPTTPGGMPSGGAAGQLGPAPDAVNVRNPTADWGGFNQFNDAVYNDATRHLDPQWADQQRQFDQQMINQGLSPGTQAYQQAYDNFNRSKNDAYGSARNQGLGAALAAQQQFFGQNLSESQLANALARAQLESSTALGTANIGANASMYNAGLGRETAMDTNALNRELGLGDLGIRADQLGLAGQQADWGNMMGLLNFGFGADQYNNSLLNQDFGRGQSMLGLIPNVNPGNIDANGAYQINAGQQQNAYNGQVANANAQNQAGASAASIALMALMMCDREVKEPLGPAVNMLEAMKSLPVEMWRYKWESTPHIGTYAQDWNRAMNLPERSYIDPRDMFGAILKALKELIDVTDSQNARLECLEAR